MMMEKIVIDADNFEQELEITEYTELSLKMHLFLEANYRIYVAARMAIDKAKEESSFLNGAYLRMILDSAAELLIVIALSEDIKEKFLDHWREGKPTNTFKLKYGGDWVKLTTGFIRRTAPSIFNELYEALNPHIHPSAMYYNRVVKMDADSLFIDMELPTEDLSGVEGWVYSLYEEIMKDYRKMIFAIKPTSSKYRVLRYSDSLMKLANQEPIEIKVFEY